MIPARPPGPPRPDVFSDLLDVQFWLMGRDVEHPDGNLLCTTLGFRREPAPRRRLASRYRRTTDDLDVVIWRCGLLLADAQDRWLLVRGLAPVSVEDGCLEQVHDLEVVFDVWRSGQACREDGLGVPSRWFADYEATVSAAVGVAHRVPRPGRRPLLAPDRPCSLEREWRAFAEGGYSTSGVANRTRSDVGGTQ